MTGRPGQQGFTLIELMLVLFIVALLASLALPTVTGGIQRAKESALKEDLYVMRRAIDDFYADMGRYPGELDELTSRRYLRHLPPDPFTGKRESWQLIRSDEGDRRGIVDVRSGTEAVDDEGVPYAEW